MGPLIRPQEITLNKNPAKPEHTIQNLKTLKKKEVTEKHNKKEKAGNTR